MKFNCQHADNIFLLLKADFSQEDLRLNYKNQNLLFISNENHMLDIISDFHNINLQTLLK